MEFPLWCNGISSVSIVHDAGLILHTAQWVKGSGVAKAAAVGGNYGSDLIPSLATPYAMGGQKKKKKKKPNKKKKTQTKQKQKENLLFHKRHYQENEKFELQNRRKYLLRKCLIRIVVQNIQRILKTQP